GDIGWNIAFHPYPQDLFDPRTWNDATATDSPDTYRITFKNLQVLVEYLRQTQMRYNGSARRVILSEQGFHGGNNGQAAQELQAAAYAYAYYKAASLPEIDAFILHRHVDHNQEGGLMLGLWTCENGEICEAGNKKLIYEIFRDIDRTNSYDISAFSLDVIRSTGVSVTDWSDVIAEFDPGTINASRPTISIANAGMVGNIDGIVPIMDPQDKTMGWYATDNVSEIALKTWDGAEAIAGAASSTYKNDFCGITYQPAVPLDLTLMPYIVIDVSATGMGSGTQAEYMLRAYSGDDVIEGAITAAKGEWNTFAFDLSGWSGLKSVDRIKIWAKPVNSYAWRDGDILIGALSAASSAYLTNALVEIDINKVSKLDDAVTVTVTNKGNDNLSANALIKGQNGLSFDLSEYELDIAPGDKTSFQIKVTAIGIVPGNAGILNVTINGIESNFTITDYVYYDYIIDANRNMVLGSFDNAMTDGWIAKINTASIESVKNVDPMPTSAPEGGYMLAATKAATLATVESSVIKNFGEPVDMSAYDVINFYFFGWGGTSASYTATLTLTAQNGASKKYELDSPPDNQWKYYTVDITDFADRDKVASISIGYRGDDMVFHGDIWTGKFCIAQIKLPLPFYNLTVNYLNSKGEQLSSPYTASGIAWHDAVNFPVYEPFALGTLSRTIFDTEYELQDLDVVSGLASMPRGDVVMNCYYTIPVDVDIDVIGGNGQVDVNFPILSANGKGYCVFIAKESDGDYELYPNVNFNAKGVHIKGLENGKEYYVIIAYTLNDQTITSDSIKIIPSK
ncbi:MAG: DUF5722 domain-containing protein, partial [Oscillospiraceae bacterium]|nr:DUF5722 domain-containing protein [Oscillospiraceae bacterium]